MTRSDALAALIAKVEAGEARHWEVEESAIMWLLYCQKDRPPLDCALDMAKAYNGSLDAALALLKAVLPGWAWGALSRAGRTGRPSAGVWQIDDENSGIEATAATPARALLLAALRALAAQEAKT